MKDELTGILVETVNGPVDVGDLGPTLMHEHVGLFWHDLIAEHPSVWNEADAIRAARQELDRVASLGIRTIVDLTVLGTGRNTPFVAKVAADCTMQIIVATGVYSYVDLPLFLYRSARDPAGRFDATWAAPERGEHDPLIELFVSDIEKGIGETEIKAGVLKVATGTEGLTPGNARMLRAVAQAHLRTGAPISTHSSASAQTGLVQQDVFASEGVDLASIIIGHAGDSTDLAYLERLVAAGSIIGMDRFGMDTAGGLDDRLDTVVAMCERGYADRMVLSHDANCVSYGAVDRHQAQLVQNPDWQMGLISTTVIPRLIDRGVAQAKIDQMMVENPRRFFARQAR